MGNIVGSKKRVVHVMKIDGATMKLSPPVRAYDLTRQHPNHVVLDAADVQSLGPRARPLAPELELKPGKKKLYFLVELPKLGPSRMAARDVGPAPRRVRSSGIQMGAKERLESLMLSKRAFSDITFVKGPEFIDSGSRSEINGEESGVLRVKMRLPKSQVEKLVDGSANGAEAAEKIIGLCFKRKSEDGVENSGNLGLPAWNPALGSITEKGKSVRQKKGVRFQQQVQDVELVA